jgi:peptide/nickel transport system substrate-binding protein
MTIIKVKPTGAIGNAAVPLLSDADQASLVDSLRRGATRRDVLARLMAAGVGVAAAGTLFAGARAALAATPNKGGNLRVAGFGSSTKDTLDPARGTFSTDYSRDYMFYNGLTRFDESLTPQPELAESWDASANAVEWVFKLRKGVEFHDGKALAAADVVYSILRLKDASVGSAGKPLADAIEEVKADGTDTVRIKLSSSNADLPAALGTSQFMIVKDGTTDFSTAVGTGPYTCKEFKPGVRSVAVRNTNYWKSDKAHVDEIEFFSIADDAARLNALLAGDAQMIGQLNPRSIKQLEAASGFEVFETKSGQFTDLVMMFDHQPSDNADLRAALKYLFDREHILKTVVQGRGALGNDQPIDPTNRFYCADIPQRGLDLDKARFHLKRAGMENQTIQVFSSDACAYGIDMAVMLQQTAQQAGLKIDVQRQPTDGYWSNIWMKRAFHFSAWNPRPTADIMFTISCKSDASWNEDHWKNAEFDALLTKARAELDTAKRKEMYCTMQRLVSDDAGRAIPCFLSYLDGISSKVKGLRPIPLGGFGGYQFAEDVWLEA